jgi:hypothetical protein
MEWAPGGALAAEGGTLTWIAASLEKRSAAWQKDREGEQRQNTFSSQITDISIELVNHATAVTISKTKWGKSHVFRHGRWHTLKLKPPPRFNASAAAQPRIKTVPKNNRLFDSSNLVPGRRDINSMFRLFFFFSHEKCGKVPSFTVFSCFFQPCCKPLSALCAVPVFARPINRFMPFRIIHRRFMRGYTKRRRSSSLMDSLNLMDRSEASEAYRYQAYNQQRLNLSR